MYKPLLIVCVTVGMLSSLNLRAGEELQVQEANTSVLKVIESFKDIKNLSQYKGPDRDNIISISRGISQEEAIKQAQANPDITYILYTKGDQLILEKTMGGYFVFQLGDAVFFKGKPTWGDAADGYIPIRD